MPSSCLAVVCCAVCMFLLATKDLDLWCKTGISTSRHQLLSSQQRFTVSGTTGWAPTNQWWISSSLFAIFSLTTKHSSSRRSVHQSHLSSGGVYLYPKMYGKMTTQQQEFYSRPQVLPGIKCPSLLTAFSLDASCFFNETCLPYISSLVHGR